MLSIMQILLLVVVVGCARAAYSPYADYDDYYFLPRPAVRYPYYALPPYENLYPPYPYYKPLVDENAAKMTEERAAREAALPIGRETYYESEQSAPGWRQTGIDDVNAAFLQNLIISQMARNAENHAPKKAPLQSFDLEDDSYNELDTRDFEDEDVRELKALAGKPISHSSKTDSHIAAPTNNYEYYDYPSDDAFINWGNKRSIQNNEQVTTTTTTTTTELPSTSTPAAVAAMPIEGQREEVMIRPATPVRHPFSEPVMKMLRQNWRQEKRSNSVYDEIKHMLEEENEVQHKPTAEDRSRLKKRFEASDPDLEAELRGLKRSIST